MRPAPPDPAGLFFSFLLRERLRTLFPPGARVLVRGSKTEGEAAFLRAGGVRVGSEPGGPPCEGAYAALDGVEGRGLAALAESLAASLRAGAPVLVCLPGPWPLPATLARALTGRGERPPNTLRPGEVKAAFARHVRWRAAYALGVLVPADGGWAESHPQAFALLASLERLVRRWPLLRSAGTRLVIEGVRA